ncbi:putative alpha-amylase [Aspergillus clavatus NRRL 1]|uniref:Alpha-amylase, putative n=1 Tax=Aspergillus clavatus (strain ATCC 1007 / CBS 513.65 / DSM 816 / NCTC 3887 / NRRL 1 / QM 1276 / 107) TaxID=344612 RepID=A1CNS8_ASPCL|nr:alpha-amylase, putative [Aspergillus clavatus NRRL 1]EAW07299.1 alpha-amylase, putative [Aspergillus clavatus NRRL 1]
MERDRRSALPPATLKRLYLNQRAENLDKLPSWDAPDNVLLMQGFEWHMPADQAHWRRLQRILPDLKEIGVDNIWIPPGCKAMEPEGNGYDIYDLYDLGEFDQKGTRATKWGTKEELLELSLAAQDLGIGLYWDAVLNHKAGADFTERFMAVEVDPQQRNLEIGRPKEIEGWVGFDFPGRGDLYSSMKYHWQHFNGVDWDQAQQKNAIYKIKGPNKNWAKDVGHEFGNYDYLMFANLDYSNAEVKNDLLQWGEWIGTQIPLKGMRLDAAKHMSAAFQKDFVDHVRQTQGADFFVVSEYWLCDLNVLLDFLKKMEDRVYLYDALLLDRFSKMSRTEGADLRLILRDTLVQKKPQNAITFVTSHDTQPGQMLAAPVAAFFKPLAYALVLLQDKGQPCVFYGDLYGIRKNVKRPMVPACHGRLPILTRARKLYAYGEQQEYFDERNCIGFVRYGNRRHPAGLACVMSNAGPAQKRMFVGRRHAGEQWTDILQWHPETVTIDKDGYGLFPVSKKSVSVWVNSEAEGRDTLNRRL